MNFNLSVKNNKTAKIDTIQINIGKLCNLSCSHCHVEANPKRKEIMNIETFDKCIELFQKFNLRTIDITGGEPTIHKDILYFLTKASSVSNNVILRSNLVNIEKNNKLLKFLFENNIHIITSLPCYTANNVDQIRGDGTFNKIITGIKSLNKIGYGKSKKLDLVYNPSSDFLPPNQKTLEKEYKIQLKKYDVEFSNLLCITNLPIGNFYTYLINENKLSSYMDLLYNNFNEKNVNNIMCKKQISIGYDGKIYDCDFNQMENLPCEEYNTINDALKRSSLERTIIFKNYCYACTAGNGSSCGGTLNE